MKKQRFDFSASTLICLKIKFEALTLLFFLLCFLYKNQLEIFIKYFSFTYCKILPHVL